MPLGSQKYLIISRHTIKFFTLYGLAASYINEKTSKLIIFGHSLLCQYDIFDILSEYPIIIIAKISYIYIIFQYSQL